MTSAAEVEDGVWLGRFEPRAPGRAAAASRRSADQSAARRALAAVAALPGARPCLALSLSHTEGVGAALVGPEGCRLGVDVVRIGRVQPRHADAILTASEWRALRSDPWIRPAVAWALKEAAAKASGAPAECFPDGLRIVADGSRRSVVRVLEPVRLELLGGWDTRRGYLWAWVVGCAS